MIRYTRGQQYEFESKLRWMVRDDVASCGACHGPNTIPLVWCTRCELRVHLGCCPTPTIYTQPVCDLCWYEDF